MKTATCSRWFAERVPASARFLSRRVLRFLRADFVARMLPRAFLCRSFVEKLPEAYLLGHREDLTEPARELVAGGEELAVRVAALAYNARELQHGGGGRGRHQGRAPLYAWVVPREVS